MNCIRYRLFKTFFVVPGNQLKDNFRIACRSKRRSCFFKHFLKRLVVYKLSVVGKRNRTKLEFVKHRLGIFYRPSACRCIAHVSYGNMSFKFRKMLRYEHVGNKSHRFLNFNDFIIAYGNSGTFLTTVLQ